MLGDLFVRFRSKSGVATGLFQQLILAGPVCGTLFALLVLAPPAFSQTGALSGTVRDPKQGVVVGAKVTVRNAANQVIDSHATKSDGIYLFSSLAPGVYDVEILAVGFKLSSSHGVSVRPGETATLDILLTLETVASVVTVQGTAEEGYRVSTVEDLGPLPSVALQNLPYSVNVMSQNLIENVQASTVDQLYRMNPFVEFQVPQTRTGSSIGYIRGFSVSTQREDGLYSSFPIIDLEDKQEVDVFTGQSGFLYGINPPGGLVNYVLKRPTETRYSSIEAGTYGGASIYAHADFGGPIDKAGRFGYRLNIVGQNGDTAIQNQSVSRDLVSAAFDWHVSQKALLQFDVSQSYYQVDGSPAVWQFANGPQAPPPAVAANELWGQEYDFDKYNANKEGARLNWDLSNIFTVRVGFARMGYERVDTYTNNVIATGNTSYSIIVLPFAPRDIDTYSGQAFLDANFHTGGVTHKLTIGFDSGNYNEQRHQDQSEVITVGTASSFDSPTYLPNPAYSVGTKPLVGFGQTLDTNFLIGDSIDFGKSWSAFVGVDGAGLTQRNYSLATTLLTADYQKRKWTPTASLIYKPIPQVSTYFTYMEGLQQGGTAPPTAANSGVSLAPDTTRQYEIGAKASLGKALVTLALFDINEAFDYLDPADNTFKSAGREDHKGAEISVTGKVIGHLNLYGGLTLLDPKVTNDAADPALDGTKPVSVADQIFKLYGEYEIPQVRGLTFTAGVYYTASTFLDTLNQFSLPSFTTGDLGIRYQRSIADHSITFRVNASNIANKSYWSSVSGGNLYTGDPRNIAASVQIRF